ncbi:hypothetical protein AALO_G00169280 [Alosa alosa]|uniref:Uncharacterized protein n=1 Tax=Alosa alosa TaxID=278164 RepID=A0AAV6GJ14_9TELE|nr:hypothetical protein AALO_G00169280 [Alosa alosa]
MELWRAKIISTSVWNRLTFDAVINSEKRCSRCSAASSPAGPHTDGTSAGSAEPTSWLWSCEREERNCVSVGVCTIGPFKIYELGSTHISQLYCTLILNLNLDYPQTERTLTCCSFITEGAK